MIYTMLATGIDYRQLIPKKQPFLTKLSCMDAALILSKHVWWVTATSIDSTHCVNVVSDMGLMNLLEDKGLFNINIFVYLFHSI